MAVGILTRTDRAAGILDRQEAEPVDGIPGLWHITDTVTGSGRVYITSAQRCDCPDHNYRGNVCKHMHAVERAEAELATYAAGWDADVRAQRVQCPDCGTMLHSDVCYIGGKGYTAFLTCTCCHYGRPA